MNGVQPPDGDPSLPRIHPDAAPSQPPTPLEIATHWLALSAQDIVEALDEDFDPVETLRQLDRARDQMEDARTALGQAEDPQTLSPAHLACLNLFAGQERPLIDSADYRASAVRLLAAVEQQVHALQRRLRSELGIEVDHRVRTQFSAVWALHQEQVGVRIAAFDLAYVRAADAGAREIERAERTLETLLDRADYHGLKRLYTTSLLELRAQLEQYDRLTNEDPPQLAAAGAAMAEAHQQLDVVLTTLHLMLGIGHDIEHIDPAHADEALHTVDRRPDSTWPVQPADGIRRMYLYEDWDRVDIVLNTIPAWASAFTHELASRGAELTPLHRNLTLTNELYREALSVVNRWTDDPSGVAQQEMDRVAQLLSAGNGSLRLARVEIAQRWNPPMGYEDWDEVIAMGRALEVLGQRILLDEPHRHPRGIGQSAHYRLRPSVDESTVAHRTALHTVLTSYDVAREEPRSLQERVASFCGISASYDYFVLARD